MDSETIINLCNNDKQSILAYIEIIAAYCEEKGKKSEDIALFIQALHQIVPVMPVFIKKYLETALDYYKVKYVIFELYKDNECILTF